MSYQTLYRKYRSQTFADLVGQEAIVRALKGAIASDRVAHAYLFSGSRGTGKTSTARLLAKAVNCMRRAPGTAEPCNECESCRQIAEGSALDLIEIDAASNRGIDEIRDLREKVNLAPALGRRKVYIIDEAHMLTPEAFNALLKTLEEPPQHVVFVLCTTEAQKVPLTVLGRCQQFVFRRFSEEQITARLGYVAEREGISIEPDALSLVARVAQGSMRDAIGLFDQLVPLTGGRVTTAAARDLLGIADPAEVEALVAALLEGRAVEALDRLAQIYERGGELRQVVRGIMERCRDLLVEAIERRDAAGRARLSGVLDALLHLDGEVRRHAEPRFLVEATLVRLAVEPEGGAAAPAGASAVPRAAAPAPLAPIGPATAAPAAPSPPPSATASPPPSATASPPPSATASPPPSATASPPPSATASPPPSATASPPPSATASPPPSATASPPPPVTGTEEGSPEPPGREAAAGWRQLLERLDVRDRAYLREARLEMEGTTLVLWFPYSFHLQKARENAARVEAAVAEWLGAETRVDFRLRPATAPAATGPAGRPLAPEEHEVVQRAVRQLEGRVTKVSIPKETRP